MKFDANESSLILQGDKKLSPDEKPEESEQTERSYLIIDPLRDMTCTVIDHSLRLHRESVFAPFVESR